MKWIKDNWIILVIAALIWMYWRKKWIFAETAGGAAGSKPLISFPTFWGFGIGASDNGATNTGANGDGTTTNNNTGTDTGSGAKEPPTNTGGGSGAEGSPGTGSGPLAQSGKSGFSQRIRRSSPFLDLP